MNQPADSRALERHRDQGELAQRLLAERIAPRRQHLPGGIGDQDQIQIRFFAPLFEQVSQGLEIQRRLSDRGGFQRVTRRSRDRPPILALWRRLEQGRQLGHDERIPSHQVGDQAERLESTSKQLRMHRMRVVEALLDPAIEHGRDHGSSEQKERDHQNDDTDSAAQKGSCLDFHPQRAIPRSPCHPVRLP